MIDAKTGKANAKDLHSMQAKASTLSEQKTKRKIKKAFMSFSAAC